ncbi:MAG TPA: hypothetical protein VKU94_05725, partial [Geobacterales bacterium]|nr:hypothetical protein [Geobacterales bacterium]
VYSYQLPELEVYTVTETSYTTTTILLPQTTTSFINTSFVASENVYPILVALAISLAVTVIVAVVLNRKT